MEYSSETLIDLEAKTGFGMSSLLISCDFAQEAKKGAFKWEN
jgi:hypothetical protein